MDRNPERRDLIDLMLGQRVAIKYISGPDITDENVDGVVGEGRILEGEPEARTAAFYLRAYSNLGVEVARKAEPGGEIFLPWGAVLAIWGPSRENLERDAAKGANREGPRRAGETGPPGDRQDLMNRLVNARTPSEVANARAAADSWLAAHPADGDVRLAREQLHPAYSEEDLEEGSPT